MQGDVAQASSDCLRDFEAGLAVLQQQLADTSAAAAQAQVGIILLALQINQCRQPLLLPLLPPLPLPCAIWQKQCTLRSPDPTALGLRRRRLTRTSRA